MGKKNENDIVFTEEDLVNDDIVFTEEDLIDNKEIPTVSLTEEEATSGLQTEPEGVSTLKDTYKKGAELNSRVLLGTYDQRPQKEVFELQETLQPEYKQGRKFTEQQLKDIAIQTNFSYPERLRNSFIQGLSPFISEASRNIGIMAKKIEDELPKVNITRGLFTDDKGNVQFNEKKSEDYATYQFADWLDKTVKDYAPTDSEMQKSIAGQLTQGAGSLTGFVLAARTGRALNLGKLGSAGLTAATGAAINGGMEYKQAKEMTEDANTLGEQEFVIKYGGDEKLYQTYVDLQGKDPDEVGYDVFQGAALIGSAEAWPVASFFRRLDKFTGGAGKKYIGNSIGKLVENIESNRLGRMALGGVEEGAQEAISQFLTNANANEIYDKSREYLDGVFESGNIGGILGLTLNAFIGGGRKAARLNPDKADEINAAVEHAEKLASKLNGVDDEAFYKAEESPKVVKLKEEQQDLTADISSLPQEQKSIVENRIEEINREIEESKKEEIASEKNDAVKEAKIKNLEGTIASLDKGIEGASEATKKVFESQKNKLVEQLNAIKNEKQEKTEGSRQDVLTPSPENAGVEQSTPVVEQAKGEEVDSGVGGDVKYTEEQTQEYKQRGFEQNDNGIWVHKNTNSVVKKVLNGWVGKLFAANGGTHAGNIHKEGSGIAGSLGKFNFKTGKMPFLDLVFGKDKTDSDYFVTLSHEMGHDIFDKLTPEEKAIVEKNQELTDSAKKHKEEREKGSKLENKASDAEESWSDYVSAFLGKKLFDVATEEYNAIPKEILPILEANVKIPKEVLSELGKEQSLPTQEVKAEKSTSTTQSEIEAKKADIERRRKEEKDAYVTKTKKEEDYTREDAEAFMRETDARLKRGEITQEKRDEIKGIIQGLLNSDETAKQYIRPLELVTELAKAEKEINAKYDAELKALQQTESLPTQEVKAEQPTVSGKEVGSGVGDVVKEPMGDNELQQIVGRDVFKQIQRSEEQLGEGIVDRNRMIETAKRIQKADKKDKLLPEHIFEALQYETGYPDNWQDLRNAIKKGGIDINSEAVQRQIEVGVNLPKDIVEEFKKSERYKNATPELVKAVEQSLPTQKVKAEQPLKETLTEKDEVKTESAKTPSEEKTGVVSDLGKTKTNDKTTRNTSDSKISQSDKSEKAKTIRRGNTTPKSKRKIRSKRTLKALDKDFSDPYNLTLQHFLRGTKINKVALEKLFGTKNNPEKTEKKVKAEAAARLGIVNYKTGSDIDEIAHSLWEEYSDLYPQYDTSDWRDAVENVIISHNSTSTMETELLGTETDEEKYYARYNGEVEREFIDEAEDMFDALTDEQKQELISEKELAESQLDAMEGYVEKNKKTDLSRLEGLKSKLKDAKQKANDIRLTSGVAEDAFEKAKKQAQADREVLNAYVDLAKYYISEGINDITTFAKEIGVAIDDTLREAWKKAGGTDDRKERRFAKQIVGAEDLQQEVKEGLSEDAKTYVPKTNAVSQKEALAIIEAKGEQETLDMIKDTNNGMKPSVRVFIGENLIKRYNKTDIKKAVETAEFLSEYATELGQGVQAFQPFSALTPEGQLLYVQKEVKRIREKQIEKAQPKIDRAAAEMRGANKEAIAEVLNVVDENISKAKDGTLAKKSVRAKQKKDLISALRKEYFQTLNDASRIAQLAVDKRTIQLAKLVLEDVADDFKAFSKQIMSALGKEIFPHLKSIYLDAGGKKAIGDVDKEVARAIKELDIDVKELVTKHYTEYDAAKKSLTDKLVKDAGMTQEDAEVLSKQIQDEFEKVADKKKKQLLKRKLQNKVVNKKRNQELYEKLIELSNLGAFSDKEFTKAYAEKAGFANITEEQANKIIDLANKIQEAPEGLQKFRATEDLLKYQENIKGVNWGEVAQSVWYANVLSGYSTQVVNTVANIYNTATLLGVASVKNPFRTPILAKALVNGWVRGIYDAADVLKTGYSPIRGKVEIPNILERVSFKGGKFNPYNYAKYVQRIMNAADTFAYEGLKEMRAYEMAAQEARKKGMKTISKETWKYVNEKMFNTKERIEDARAQAKDEGLTGIDYKRRVFEILEQSRPPEMVEDSKHYAARGTFNYQPEGTIGLATNWVNQLTDAVEIKGVRPLKFIVPFTRIIGNVTNNALDYTPYGFGRAAKGSIGIEGYSKRSKTAYRKFTPEQQREAIIKASLGTVMMAALYALTQPDDEGKSEVEITGAGTGDFKKDYELKQTGWQPYSLRIGDTWYSYKETPFVLSLSLLGNYRDNIKYKGASEEDALDSFAYSASSTANLLSDMTFLGSATDFVSSLSSGDANKLGTYLKTKGRSTLKGFVVPNLYTQAAKEVEIANNQALKDPKTTVEYLMQDIPVARNSQNDKINSLGEPVLPDTDRLTSEREKDPIWNYIVENRAWIGKPNQKASFIVDGDIERPMNDDEYYEFIKLSGKYIREGVEELMREDLEKSEIKKSVERIKENSRRLAKEELFSKNIN